MSDKAARTATTKSGITTNASGDRHIPSSKRADGSVRKEIRVRPGYRPPEDVEIYRNKTAEAWKNRGSGGVPGAQFVTSKRAAPSSKSKPKEKSTELESAVVEEKSIEEKAEPVDAETQKEKEAKKLSKRLRQAKELQQKKEEGGALLPEQLEKVVRINELLRQLNLLGYDTDGKRKDPKKEDLKQDEP